MHPVFQKAGNDFFLILRLQMNCMMGTIVGPAVFNNLDVMPSVPHDDEGDNSLSTLVTVRRSTSWKSKTGHGQILVDMEFLEGGFLLVSLCRLN